MGDFINSILSNYNTFGNLYLNYGDGAIWAILILTALLFCLIGFALSSIISNISHRKILTKIEQYAASLEKKLAEYKAVEKVRQEYIQKNLINKDL